MKLGHTAYTVDDKPVKYTWVDHLFGPMVSDHDTFCLEVRAFNEGWSEWYDLVLAIKNSRKRRWMLAYLRDDIIKVTVKHHPAPDPYEDDDPWEGM